MFVSDILAQKGTSVHSVSPTASVAEVSQQLSVRRIGAVLVVDGHGSVQGIVSERDVVRALASEGAAALALVLAALVAVPVAIGNPFIYHVFITICVFAALSTAWNIVGGYAGQLSLGHGIFYGLGAYASAILTVSYGVPSSVALVAGVILTAAVAYGFGIPTAFFALALGGQWASAGTSPKVPETLRAFPQIELGARQSAGQDVDGGCGQLRARDVVQRVRVVRSSGAASVTGEAA